MLSFSAWVFSKQLPPWGGDPSFGLRHNMNNAIFEKEKIVVWSVTVQDVYLGRNLVRLGDFKIGHKAFSQDLVYLTFTLVFHGCHYSRFIRIKLSAAPTVPGDAGRGRLEDISAHFLRWPVHVHRHKSMGRAILRQSDLAPVDIPLYLICDV